MPTLLLIRHGQASFGAEDYDALSDRGRQQSAVVAEELVARSQRITRITSGTLVRQRDTAAPTATALGLDTTVDARWNEYDMDAILTAHPVGSEPPPSAAGAKLSSAEFQDRLEHALTAWIAAGETTPALESWPQFAERVVDAVMDARQSVPAGETGVVFTSGGVIAALCREVLDLAPTQLLALNRVAVNTGITKLVSGRRGVSLISFNDHGHLERAGGDLVTYR